MWEQIRKFDKETITFSSRSSLPQISASDMRESFETQRATLNMKRYHNFSQDGSQDRSIINTNNTNNRAN